MPDRTLVVFTFRPLARIVQERGTQAWSLNAGNARRCTYIVCTRNRYFAEAGPEDQAAAQEGQGAAFMIGRITTVEPSPERDDRYIVRFDEYAVLAKPDVWSGARNPVRYVDDIADLGIDPNALNWLRIPDEPENEDLASDLHFDEFCGALGRVILEFNYLEVAVGGLMARLLNESEPTAQVFAGASRFMEKLKLIRMLAITKVPDATMRQELDVILKKANGLNAERNRYFHAEYIPMARPNGELVEMRYRRLRDGGKVIDGSKIRTVHDLLKLVDKNDLKHLAADINKLADRTRTFAQEYYERY